VKNDPSPRRYVRSAIAALALLTGALQAYGTDTYEGSDMLQIPTLGIGSATFSNVVLTVNLPQASGPSGTTTVWPMDTYTPATNLLTVPALRIGSTTYYNATATVHQLISIGNVAGADTFDGTNLVLRNVQVNGGQSYHNVTLHVGLGNVAANHGGMPSVAVDQYDTATGQLTIAAVLVGAKVYTNVVLKVGLSDVTAVTGWTEQVLYSFQYGGMDQTPDAGLVMDASGNLFGTTIMGQPDNRGAVYELTPSVSGGYTAGVLQSFTSTPGGCNPFAGLILDARGNLYGTTRGCGSGNTNIGGGTVFELTPNGSGGYTESVLYSFCSQNLCTDGSDPYAGLVMDAGGNLYGTTEQGGTGNFGTVFKLTPTGSGGYTESVLYSFCSQISCTDGSSPVSGLILDASGNLYGTAGGGSENRGVVFELSPGGGGAYSYSVLYDFCPQAGCADGWGPQTGGLILDTIGNLYGTTNEGGSAGNGTVFELTANGSGGFTERVLYSFQAGVDGNTPMAGLIRDAGGNLYGTTEHGGSGSFGTVFKLTPNGSGGYTEKVVFSFPNVGNGESLGGAEPLAGLIMDASGNLYGTTSAGGAQGYDYGVVFQIH
jgi:uncharacterized repeat protein (TIGR03803 family)